MLSEDVIACARLVERGDPDRFTAVMAAPVAVRARLFPLYAFNVEISRAPWVTTEPMIAAMRLQWWRDALAEIRAGGTVRRHEVVTPLAEVLSAKDTELLDDLIQARHWDIERVPFQDQAALMGYLGTTSGNLMVVASRVLGGGVDAAALAAGQAMGVASFLSALPEFCRHGGNPLPGEQSIHDLAVAGMDLLNRARAEGRMPRAVMPAFLPLWSTRTKLRRAMAHPDQVQKTGLEVPPLRGRMALLRQVWTGRF